MAEIAQLHKRFKAGVRVLGDDETLNQSLEKAGRVDDFFELAQLMCRDALHREESCGGHFREEHQTPDGEALRDDENFSYVAAWEYNAGGEPVLHREDLTFQHVRPTPAELRMRLTLRVWRQAGPTAPGAFETYEVDEVTDEMSFLELLDVLERAARQRGPRAGRVRLRLPRGHLRLVRADDRRAGPRPAARHRDLPAAHAPLQRRRRRSPSSRSARAGFPLVKDLVVDRSAFDRIIESGGFITAPTGSAPDANLIAVPKEASDRAMDAAQCIGCGACVAACPNGAGQLFTAAKLAHLNLLPQGQPERQPPHARAWSRRWRRYFGSCTNHRECEAGVPEGDLDRLHRHAQPRLPEGPSLNHAQIDRLLSSVPETTEPRHLKRVHGYATTARRIDARISALRVELERALRAVDDAVEAGDGDEAADEALELARELDSLERVQPRVDSWLRVAVGAVADDPGLEPFGEGPA